jgi:hypothetical protein
MLSCPGTSKPERPQLGAYVLNQFDQNDRVHSYSASCELQAARRRDHGVGARLDLLRRYCRAGRYASSWSICSHLPTIGCEAELAAQLAADLNGCLLASRLIRRACRGSVKSACRLRMPSRRWPDRRCRMSTATNFRRLNLSVQLLRLPASRCYGHSSPLD